MIGLVTYPQLVPVLAERLPAIADLPPIGDAPPDPEAMRAWESFNSGVDGYVAPDVRTYETVAPGPHGEVPVRVYRAGDDASRGLVWAHGGAFMFGDLDMPEADVVAREIAQRAGAVVVSVDYRLCHGGVHFPVPHDDVHAAFAWAAGNTELLPSGAAWAIGGASAGGNLAAGVAQRLRDEDAVVADALVLAYPVLHDPLPAGPEEHRARIESLPAGLRFTPEATAGINRNFLGPNPPDVPYAFAGLGTVDGLPPTLIVVCEYDDLLPSGADFAQTLEHHGVDVQLKIVEGVTHGHLNIPGLPEALNSLQMISDFLTLHDLIAGLTGQRADEGNRTPVFSLGS